MSLVHPVIVVPGITATYLRDEYPLPPEYIWTVIKKDYERVALHPNNLRYEAREPARLMPGQIYEIAYEELVEELRFNLRSKEEEPVPVYPFGYDWRMPLEDIEREFSDFVSEVMERTKIMKHYHRDGYSSAPMVNLVGHSMGGLIITGYLERHGTKAPVNKVVTLATPYQGSFEAIIKVTTGTANLGTSPPSSRERESARITPALYYLLPSFSKGVEVADPTVPTSLFDPGAWQPSVTDSIAEFIRTSGLPTTDRKKQAQEIFSKLLENAKKHRARIDGFKLSNVGKTKDDFLVVIGVGAVTRVRIKIVKRGGVPDFELSSEDRMDKWANTNPDVSRMTGDGTVPFEGAIPKFLGEENIVCVTPDDYGYWEIEDKALTKIGGFHGILPNMNMVHRLIVRFFTGKPDKHENTWGRRIPGVTNWQPPLKLTEKS